MGFNLLSLLNKLDRYIFANIARQNSTKAYLFGAYEISSKIRRKFD